MKEAPNFAPDTGNGFTPNSSPPNNSEFPYHLRKSTLRKIDYEEGIHNLWNERGNFVEKRVQKILATQPIIKEVKRHGKDSAEDREGHDLTVIFNGDSFDSVYIQVKSNRDGIVDFKRRIRNRFFPHDNENMELVGKWMTEHKLILLNGSETKSDAEILESFYPQLERIQKLIKKSEENLS